MSMECLTGNLVEYLETQGLACWLSVYHPTGKHVSEVFMNPLASMFIANRLGSMFLVECLETQGLACSSGVYHPMGRHVGEVSMNPAA